MPNYEIMFIVNPNGTEEEVDKIITQLEGVITAGGGRIDKVEKMGKVIAGDGGTYHRVEFTALTFSPKLQEIVRGEIVVITDFGAFVRIGATDALLHLSQIMDDYLKSDVKSGMILANQSGRTMKIGTTLRARITAVSIGKTAAMKVGITCRQPFLGADEWIDEEIKKSKNPAAAAAATKTAAPEKAKKTAESK